MRCINIVLYSVPVLYHFCFFFFKKKDLIEFINIALDFQRSTREIETQLLLEITTLENQSSYPGSDPTYISSFHFQKNH